jgi:hypothetical protein
LEVLGSELLAILLFAIFISSARLFARISELYRVGRRDFVAKDRFAAIDEDSTRLNELVGFTTADATLPRHVFVDTSW